VETRYSCTASGRNSHQRTCNKVVVVLHAVQHEIGRRGTLSADRSPKPRAVLKSDVTPASVTSVEYTSRPASGRSRTSAGSITAETPASSVPAVVRGGSKEPRRVDRRRGRRSNTAALSGKTDCDTGRIPTHTERTKTEVDIHARRHRKSEILQILRLIRRGRHVNCVLARGSSGNRYVPEESVRRTPRHLSRH